MLLNILKKNKGQALALVAIMIPTLLGMAMMVIDVGTLYLTKTQLQTAADQGALAGCYDLNGGSPSPTNAKSNGEGYAHQYPGQVTDTVVATVTYNTAMNSVKVDTSRTLQLFFAPLFGINASTVTATATAKLNPASSIPPGAPPFVIKAPTNIKWQGGPQGDSYSQPYHMKKTPVATEAEDFTYVNGVFKNPTNSTDYLDLLANGYSQTTNLDTKLYHIGPATASETAVNSFASRLTAGGNQDVLQAKTGDPRLMLIPIVADLSTSTQLWDYSTSKMQIVGFVGFWFDSINKGALTDQYGNAPQTDRNGKIISGSYYYLNFVVTGRFVRVALPTGTGTVVSGQQWYGVGTMNLVQ